MNFGSFILVVELTLQSKFFLLRNEIVAIQLKCASLQEQPVNREELMTKVTLVKLET